MSSSAFITLILMATSTLFSLVNPTLDDGGGGGVGVAAKTYMANFAKRHGYPMERFETLTEDGYFLTLYLMPQKGEKRWDSKIVFLNHPLLSSSNVWFINHPSARLAFQVYDLGFNVMLGNFRGTTHSRRHVSLSTNSTKYWNFRSDGHGWITGWDEHGRYDLAAMIDYTLNVMKQGKLFLIGYSMGTTTAFVLLSERPEYNDKIYRFIAIAPSTFQFHSTSRLRFLAPLLANPFLHRGWQLAAGPYGMLPPGYARLEKWRKGCVPAIIGKYSSNSSMMVNQLRAQRCQQRLYTLLPIDQKKIGRESYEAILSTPFETTSVKTILHYAQSMTRNHFRRYDYGGAGNLKMYGSRNPPDYDLSRVTCPTSLYWGPNDDFANKQDVATLIQKMGNSSRLQVHYIDKKPWSHFEYILSESSGLHLNEHILRTLKASRDI